MSKSSLSVFFFSIYELITKQHFDLFNYLQIRFILEFVTVNNISDVGRITSLLIKYFCSFLLLTRFQQHEIRFPLLVPRTKHQPKSLAGRCHLQWNGTREYITITEKIDSETSAKKTLFTVISRIVFQLRVVESNIRRLASKASLLPWKTIKSDSSGDTLFECLEVSALIL